MGFTELEQRLVKEARAEKKEIQANAEKQAAAEISKYQRDIDLAYSQEEVRSIKSAEAQAKGIVGKAKLDASIKINEAKKQLIDEAFEKATQKIYDLSEKSKKKLINNWLTQTQIDHKDAKIQVSKECKHLLPHEKFKITEADIGDFGFIITSKDEKTSQDYRLCAILERLKPELVPKMTKIMWGTKKDDE